MITPQFQLSQTDNDVTINIYARYANIKETEISVEGTDFHFSSPPFYLRLSLPGEIIENDFASGSYDCDTGTFLLKFPKVNPGEHFDNLDMITTLLAPSNKNTNFNVGPSIEVIGNPAAEQADDSVINLDDNTTTNGDEWHFPQVAAPSVSILSLNAPKYGFANKISGALSAFDPGWLTDVVDLPSPDTTPINQRQTLRIANELNEFKEEHYLADLFEPDEELDLSLTFKPFWYDLTKENIDFTSKEKDILKELPNKEFLLDNEETQIALFGLVDILFGSCYNHRTTLGENTPESSLNINKLSSTLSWFDKYSSMKDVVNTCMRRSLCFQRFRHWTLSMKVFDDVRAIIKLGKKLIIKRFCEIYELFNNSFEPRYILNQLYIKDYLIWLQKVSDSLIESIGESLVNITPKKENMNLEIPELEAAAWSCIEEVEDAKNMENNLIIENEIYNIANGVDKIIINNDNNISSPTSDSDDSSDSSSDSDSDSSTSDSTTSSSSSSDSSSSLNSFTTSSDTDDIKIKNNIERLDSDDDSD